MSSAALNAIEKARESLVLARGALVEADKIAAVQSAIADLDALDHKADAIETLARILVDSAERSGYVLTIEQRPLQPLAMGNYETVVSVRPARVRS